MPQRCSWEDTGVVNCTTEWLVLDASPASSTSAGSSDFGAVSGHGYLVTYMLASGVVGRTVWAVLSYYTERGPCIPHSSKGRGRVPQIQEKGSDGW